MPDVSVVLAAYNSPLVVAQLDSIAAQVLPAAEVIIVNDSTDSAMGPLIDGTVSRLRSLSPETRFVVRHNERNLGMYESYEWALRAATSPIIAMCDHDDVWLPQKLAETAPRVEQSGRAVCHDVSVFFGVGSPPSVPSPDRLSERSLWTSHAEFDGKPIPLDVLLHRNRLSGTSLVFPASLVDEILPLPRDVFPDYWVALMAATRIGLIWEDLPLVHYRRHDANTVVLGAGRRGLREPFPVFESDTIDRLRDGAKEELRPTIDEWKRLSQWRHAVSVGSNRRAAAASVLRRPSALRFYESPRGILGDLARLLARALPERRRRRSSGQPMAAERFVP